MAVEFGERSLRMLNLKPSSVQLLSWLLLALWHLPVSGSHYTLCSNNTPILSLLILHGGLEFGCSCFLTELGLAPKSIYLLPCVNTSWRYFSSSAYSRFILIMVLVTLSM